MALLRKEADLTQEEAAKRMGVARPCVAELESRPVSVSFVRMIAYANALGVPIERIAGQLKKPLNCRGPFYDLLCTVGRSRR